MSDTSKKEILIKKGLRVLIPILIVILSIAGISSFSNSDNKTNNSNQNNSNNDNKKLAIYLENDSGEYELSSDRKFPKNGYVLDTEKTTCKNGGTITQDPTTKSINGSFGKADSCNLYFKRDTNGINTLISKSNNSSVTDYNLGNKTEMYTFTHPEAEQTTGWSEEERTDYRYIGNTPNNYVTFNDEVWRIIGVFTVENENGEKEQRIKIIRDASLGNMSWDMKSDGTYSNEWISSTLNTMLNGDYINKGGLFDYTWYNSSGMANTITINGLGSTAQSQVTPVKWYLGGNSTSSISALDCYSNERGTNVVSGRDTKTVAKVGLIYPSDYIYTYALGVDNTCYSNGYNCQTSTSGNPLSGWLFNTNHKWTITSHSSNKNNVFSLNGLGYLNHYSVNYDDGVRPSLYLKSDIEIISGNGSSGNPYKLKN